MPTRKTEKITCELCCDTLEKGQDTLKCEGECGCVVHRYCAGVTKRHFEGLSKGHDPFVCQWCFMKMSRSIIVQLQAEIASWKSEVASLRSELSTTKEALVRQREQTDRAPPPSSYASVISQPPQVRSRQGQRRGTRTNTRGTNSRASESANRETATNVRNSSAGATAKSPRSRDRVRVEGARRIWGTHPHATTRTIENAIDRFCNIQDLNIKRKISRNRQSGKSSWWFVLHAEESVLKELESKWDSLSTQTSWSLKPCSKPRDVEDSGGVAENVIISANSQLISATPAEQLPTAARNEVSDSLNQSTAQVQSSQEDAGPGTGDN
jgi:hypothetical protein